MPTNAVTPPSLPPFASLPRFRDRADAGRELARRLLHLRPMDPVVLGVTPGGALTAEPVARLLGARLDVAIVRPLSLPRSAGVVGAVGEDGVRILTQSSLDDERVSGVQLVALEAAQRAELDRLAALYRGGGARIPLAGRTVIVVDDGLHTGTRARVACASARRRGATWVVLAVPLAPGDWVDRLGGAADDFVVVCSPSPFRTVATWYQHFDQPVDAEVVAVMHRERRVARTDHRPTARDHLAATKSSPRPGERSASRSASMR